MGMACAFSLVISASCWPMISLAASQAKCASLSPVVLVEPRAWIAGIAAGWADTEMAVAERKRMMDVRCILREYGGIELQGGVRECPHGLLPVTYSMIVV